MQSSNHVCNLGKEKYLKIKSQEEEEEEENPALQFCFTRKQMFLMVLECISDSAVHLDAPQFLRQVKYSDTRVERNMYVLICRFNIIETVYII